jgi:flagellar biosynthesis GTPase FlhF
MMLGGHEMPEITVTALDSATAMEEVVKRLGMDALIVSTRRVGSQIEIVATNEEMVSGKTQDQPKQKKSTNNANFSDLLKSKLANATDETSSDIAPPRNKREVLKTIRDELRLLEDIMDQSSENKPNRNTVLDAFRLAGLSKRVKSHLPDLDATASTTDLSKMIAKKFVRGQSDEFDNSDIYFVVGLEKSGKSTFVEKLRKFIETQNPDLTVHIFKNVTGLRITKMWQIGFQKKLNLPVNNLCE